MRLFCGLSLAYEVRRNLELLFEHLHPLAALHWSPPNNWHVTTKFIGEWPDERVGQIKEILAGLPAAAVPVHVGGLGWFPNPHQPRVFYVGVEPTPELTALARDTDRALARIGVAAETKPYQPHITLARIKGAPDLSALRRSVAALPSSDCGRYRAVRHLLYRSRTSPEGSVYSVEAEFPLGGDKP